MRCFGVPLMLSWWAGCDAFTGPGPFEHVGTYSLVMVDGADVPARISTGFSTNELQVTGGQVTLEREVAGLEPKFTLWLATRRTDQAGTTEDTLGHTGVYRQSVLVGNSGGHVVSADRFRPSFEAGLILCPAQGCGRDAAPNAKLSGDIFSFSGNAVVLSFRKQ